MSVPAEKIEASSAEMERLEAELLRLPPSVRAHLARVLADSVPSADEDAFWAEWGEEAERRYQAVVSGEVRAREVSEVLNEIRGLLER